LSIGVAAVVFSVRFLIYVFFLVVALIVLMRAYLFFTRSRAFKKIFRPRKLKFTREGILFILMTIGLGGAAINSGNNLLYLILAMMLSLIIASGMLSEINFRRVTVERRPPETAFAGRRFRVDFILTNGKKHTPAFTLEPAESGPEGIAVAVSPGRLTAVGGGEKAVISYTAEASARGYAIFKQVELSSSYPFNFFMKTIKMPCPGKVLVYPRILPVREESLIAREHGPDMQSRLSMSRRGDGEFHGLREFRHGDSPKRIHWRTSAKKGALHVKEFEEHRFDRMAVALDTQRGPDFTNETLEKAVMLAAAIITHYHRKGFETALYAFAPQPLRFRPDRGRTHHYMMLEALALLKTSISRTLAEAAALPERADLDGAVLFAIRMSDSRASRLGIELLRKRSQSVTDVPAFDGTFERVLET
jgi:uncharacterized protein (DUF58 family)